MLSLETVEGTEQEIWDNNKSKLTRLVGGWLTSELFKLMNQENITAPELKITPENFAEFITLIYQKKINSSAAQKVLKIMFTTGGDPSHIIEENDLTQNDNADELAVVIDRIIQNNPEQVAQYKNGKASVFQYFVGMVMRETKGKANPETAQKLLKEKLD